MIHKKGLMNVLLLTAVWLSAITVMAQNKDDLQRVERIKNDNGYLWGEGFGQSDAEATKQAHAALAQQISTTITSTMDIIESEVNVNNQLDARTEVQSVVSSYSSATLRNTKVVYLSKPKDRDKHVFVYIAKEEIDKMFKAREDKVMDLVRQAGKAEQDCKIGAALKYYYHALALLQTLQYPDNLYDEYQTKLTMALPAKISEILTHLQTEVSERKGNKLSLLTTYKGEHVKDGDFTYYTGMNESPLNGINDGVSEVELSPNYNPEQLSITYEYRYDSAVGFDKDLSTALKRFDGDCFRKEAVKLIDIPRKDKVVKSVMKRSEDLLQTSSTLAIHAEKDTKELADIMAEIIQAIKGKSLKDVSSHFTPDGWDMCNKLLEYGKAEVIGNPKFSFYGMGEYMVCRSVPMKFSFENNLRQFVEKVTFTFNKDNKIDAIAFGLGDEAVTHIFDRNVGNWSENSRMVIANFLENYKTAFALQRIDYIRDLFDDNAVIVTGHVVKKIPKKSLETGKYLDNEYVEYNRLDKNQYMAKLEQCFDSNEYINIQFTDNDIHKGNTEGEVFGIRLHQNYYSSTYGDSGYLFLLLDITNPDKPTIYVRTWQPERDPNVNAHLPKDHPCYGIFNIGNF